MTRSSSAPHATPPSRLAPKGLALAFLIVTAGIAARVVADETAPSAPAVPALPPAAPMPSAEPTTPVTPPMPASPRSGEALPSPESAQGRAFDTPEAAAAAMLLAFEKNDDAALREILGAGAEDLVQDGKDPIVQTSRTALAAAAKAKQTLEKQADGHVVLVVGRTDYPLAIPFVSKDGHWRADAAAGREELLARRIGEHELEAIGVCLAYADAQVAYASKDRNEDGVKEYAQKLVSTPGAYDGLNWDAPAGEEQSPAGPGLTPLQAALTSDAAPAAPFNGYYWRILTSQGANAPGGAYSYVINGRMIAGFALLAVPSAHRNTGVMSFLVSNQGKVYEKDLGPDTLKAAAAIEAFDPDESWHVVDDATLRSAATTSPEDTPYGDKAEAAEAVGESLPPSIGGDEIPSPSTAPTRAPAPSAPGTAPCPQR